MKNNSLKNINYKSNIEKSSLPILVIDFIELIKAFKTSSISNYNKIIEKLESEPKTAIQFTKKLKVIDANQAVVNLYQAKNKKQIIGNLSKIITPKVNSFVKEILIAFFKGEKTYNWTFEFTTLEGSKRFVECYIKLEKLTKDEAIASLIFDDISELEYNKDKQNKLTLNKVIESSLTGIFITNKSGKLTFVNSIFKKIFKYQKNDNLIGMSYHDFVAPSHIKIIEEKFQSEINKEKPISRYQFNGLTKDKEEIELEINVTPFSYNKSEIQVIGHILDISKTKSYHKILKLKEQKLNNILQHTSDSILIGDKKGNIIECNYAIIRLSGYSKKELLKMNINELFSKKELLQNPLRYDILNQGKSITNRRVLLHKNKQEIFIEMNSNLLPNNNYISIIRDITDTINYENKLIESENLFSSIVKYSFEGIALIDKNQKFVYCNSNLSEITGYEIAELIGTDFTKLLTQESIESVVARFHDRINKKNVPARYVLKIKCKNGEKKILENSAAYYIGADGNPYTIAQLKDITEQYRERQLLEISEKKLKSIVEYSLVGIGMINENYTFVYANDTLSVIFGYPIDEIINTNFKNFLTKESLKLVTERYEKRQAGEKTPRIYEFSIKRKNGEIRFVEMSSTIIPNNDGSKQTLIHIQDITEIKEKNESIKTSREQYKSIFDGAYDAIIHLDDKFNILNINKSFEKMSGLSLEELIGKNPYYIAERLIPKDNISTISSIIKSSFNNGSIKPIEIEIETGKKIIEFTAQKQSNDETIVVLRDITFRKNAEKEIHKKEAKYQQLFNFSPNPIIIHDGKYIIDINQATVFASNLKDKSELIGKELLSLAHPNDKERIIKQLKKLKKTNKSLASEEFTILLNDGREIEVLATHAPIEIGDEKLYLLAYQDISDIKQKEREIKEANEYLKNIFDATSDAILVYDASTYKIVNINRQAKIMYGYSKEEITQRKIPLSSNNKSPFSDDDAISKIKETKKIGKQTFEWLSSRKDGTKFWSEVSLNKAIIGKNMFIIASVRDINDRKIASLKLKESQERFKQLSSLSFEGIIIHENAKIIDVNYAMEKISGYSYNEIISNNVIEMFLAPEYKPLAYEKMERSETTPYQVVGVKKNGKRINIEIESRNIKVGARYLRVTAVRDISEKIIQQKKLEKSNQEILSRETTLRAIFDNSIVAIFIQDKNGTFIDVNKGAVEMYGYSKEELIGKDPAFISADNRNDLNHISKLLNLVYNGEAQQFEFWGKRKNGEVFPKLVKITKGTYFGEDVVFAFAHDISENKKHKQIQDILYNVLMYDSNRTSMEEFAKYIQFELGKIIDTTNFYIGLYNSNDNTFSFPYYSDVYDNADKTTANKTLGKYVMETGKPLLADYKTKKKLIKEGKLIPQGTFSNEWMGAPLKSDNDIIGVMAVQNYKKKKAYSKDDLNIFYLITQQIGRLIKRKEQEEKLKSALLKAEESDRLKSAFLTNMSHEIRTPMNGILGFTSLLKQNIISEKEKADAYDIIEKSGKRLLNIINDLIDISKIEAGQTQVKISEFIVYEQLKDLYNFFLLETKKKKLILKLTVPELLRNIKIKTDYDKMNSILTNLIKNAIKYTPKGEIEFGYNIMTNHLKFYVKDTGMGISKDRHKAIFERFVQADIEDKKAMEGAGLGLAITKAYVDMLGGDIWLKSTPNKGTTIYFTIPIEKMEASIINQQIEDNKIAPKLIKAKDIDMINILIAEDDKVSFFYLKTLLKFDNVRVIRASNGFEAVSIMKSNSEIDLILMDIRMPKMGGLEATRLIRKFNKEVIIIAQTANAMEKDKIISLKAGCNDYISKPIFKDVFYKVIEDNLQRKLGY